MSTPHADTHPAVRLAGACGIGAAVLLLAAPTFPESTGVALWIVGFLLLLPFLAGIATLARDAGGRAAWLSPAIPAAGAVLVSVHLTNVGIQYVANHLSKSSPAHEPLHEVGGALFTLGMLPFGLALVATAVVGLAGRALPRWLAWMAAAAGMTALVNGIMLGSEAAWGFLASVAWVLAGGVALAARGSAGWRLMGAAAREARLVGEHNGVHTVP